MIFAKAERRSYEHVIFQSNSIALVVWMPLNEARKLV